MNRARLCTPLPSYVLLMLSFFSLPALADVPLASREADRQAKSTVPATTEALVYVFRQQDANAAPLAVNLSGRETARLAPRTFMLWKVKPGRVELTVERSASALTLTAAGGRVYYVELARAPSGVPTLRSVSFPTGRAAIQRAQLVAQAAPAAPPRSTPAPPAPRQPGKFALMFKLGSFKLAETSQAIDTNVRAFDTSASSVFAAEGEWFVWPDIALGLELLRYANDFSTPGFTNRQGEVEITAFLFNAKRYFLPDSAWQPYVGAGVGGANTDFSGVLSGSVGAVALQLTGGVQWRRGQFALRGEYKYLSAKGETDSGQDVDMSGSGIFLGAGFHF